MNLITVAKLTTGFLKSFVLIQASIYTRLWGEEDGEHVEHVQTTNLVVVFVVKTKAL